MLFDKYSFDALADEIRTYSPLLTILERNGFPRKQIEFREQAVSVASKGVLIGVWHDLLIYDDLFTLFVGGRSRDRMGEGMKGFIGISPSYGHDDHWLLEFANNGDNWSAQRYQQEKKPRWLLALEEAIFTCDRKGKDQAYINSIDEALNMVARELMAQKKSGEEYHTRRRCLLLGLPHR